MMQKTIETIRAFMDIVKDAAQYEVFALSEDEFYSAHDSKIITSKYQAVKEAIEFMNCGYEIVSINNQIL